jgi:DNA-binding transcriptional ArsR family regulator
VTSIATLAGLLSDPVRLSLVQGLMDGRAWTAGELARSAGASPQLASHHLARLIDAGVVEVRPQGRHRYHRLASVEMARAFESLAVAGASVAAPGSRQVRAPQDLWFARSCYDHLAGTLGVAVGERALARGLMGLDGAITPAGSALLDGLGCAPPAGCARRCLDWTERRDHWAGGFANALFCGLLERRVLNRVEGTRGLVVTSLGGQWLREKLGLDLGVLRAA